MRQKHSKHKALVGDILKICSLIMCIITSVTLLAACQAPESNGEGTATGNDDASTPEITTENTAAQKEDEEPPVVIEKVDMTNIENLSYEEAEKLFEKKAESMRLSVIHAGKLTPNNGRVIYLSADGSDKNDGLTINTPIQTVSQLNRISQEGDTVLFRCEDHFRGNPAVKEYMTFASYGKGIKPIIDSSDQNYAKASLWKETDTPNVYKLILKVKNVGIVHFDPSYTEYGKYDELYGKKRIPTRSNHKYGDIDEDLEFYSDMSTNDLYLYSS